MKALVLLGLACLVAAAATAQQGDAYRLTDTTRWSNSMYGGERALLVRGERVLDTVDVFFGLQHVPGGVLFLPVRSSPDTYDLCDADGRCWDFTTYVLFDGRNWRELADIAPAVMAGWSAPAVIDSVLYYWGLVATPAGSHDLTARRYDFRTGEGDSAYVHPQSLDSDCPCLFRPPVRDAGFIRFEAPGHVYWFTPGLQPVRDSVAAG